MSADSKFVSGMVALLMTATFSFASAEEVMVTAEDGTPVYGETFYGDLGDGAPIIALFHQAGGDGRGEYGPLTGWLNENGFRAIAWDQRSGGNRFGGDNRTLRTFCSDPGYCAALPDLEAGLAYTVEAANGAPVAVWGSSYSAALVFRLAAANPSEVDAVIAASPASGGPMEACRLDPVLGDVKAAILAMRPRSEYEFTKEQADMLIKAGATLHVVENGVHGSSMLVDERTENDMTADREFVAGWLKENLSTED